MSKKSEAASEQEATELEAAEMAKLSPETKFEDAAPVDTEADAFTQEFPTPEDFIERFRQMEAAVKRLSSRVFGANTQ